MILASGIIFRWHVPRVHQHPYLTRPKRDSGLGFDHRKTRRSITAGTHHYFIIGRNAAAIQTVRCVSAAARRTGPQIKRVNAARTARDYRRNVQQHETTVDRRDAKTRRNTLPVYLHHLFGRRLLSIGTVLLLISRRQPTRPVPVRARYFPRARNYRAPSRLCCRGETTAQWLRRPHTRPVNEISGAADGVFNEPYGSRLIVNNFTLRLRDRRSAVQRNDEKF